MLLHGGYLSHPSAIALQTTGQVCVLASGKVWALAAAHELAVIPHWSRPGTAVEASTSYAFHPFIIKGRSVLNGLGLLR